jgi:hypothetical protein
VTEGIENLARLCVVVVDIKLAAVAATGGAGMVLIAMGGNDE